MLAHKIPTREILDPQNTHKKRFPIHKITTRQKSGPTKYPQDKILNLQNTHKRNFRLTKYPWEKILDTLNNYKKKSLDP